MATVSDPFDGSANPLGAPWVTFTGYNAVKKVSGTARVTAYSANCGAYRSGSGLTGTYQSAQAVAGTGHNTGNTYFGLLVRCSNDGDGYLFMHRCNGTDGQRYRMDNGTASSLGTNFNSGGFVAGDTAKLIADGSNLSFEKNGSQKSSATDSTYSSGDPGIFPYAGTAGYECVMDDFTATDGLADTGIPWNQPQGVIQ